MKLFLADVIDKALNKGRLAAELFFVLLVQGQEGQNRNVKGTGSFAMHGISQLQHGTQLLAWVIQRAGPVQHSDLACLLMTREFSFKSLHFGNGVRDCCLGLVPVLAVHREIELGPHKRKGFSDGEERGSIRRKRKKASSTDSASETGKGCNMEEGSAGQSASRVYRVVHGKCLPWR